MGVFTGYKRNEQKPVETSFIVQPIAAFAVPFKYHSTAVLDLSLIFQKERYKHTGFLSLNSVYLMSIQTHCCKTGVS